MTGGNCPSQEGSRKGCRAIEVVCLGRQGDGARGRKVRRERAREKARERVSARARKALGNVVGSSTAIGKVLCSAVLSLSMFGCFGVLPERWGASRPGVSRDGGWVLVAESGRG